MKGFVEWFKNSTKIKRWMFLILIGMILVCNGISKILVLESLNFKNLIELVISFVIGFILFVIGIVQIQRRSLELVIEANTKNKDEDDNEINIKTLISKKNIYEKGPKIVVIGGGTGLNNMLKGLKKYTSNITAIVAVSSYGEEKTGSIRELNLKPVDDIKRSIVALSLKEKEMENVIDYKFSTGKLSGLTFGDVYLSTMERVFGNFAGSIEKSSDILSIVGKVLPVTLDEMKICAELHDGTVIEEKDKIAEVVSAKITKIDRVYINPSNCRTAPGIIEAIKEADSIVLGPGSLYTNVIPNLLIKNVAKAIKDSKAQKIYVSNIMTEPGQTDDYEVSDHIKAIIEHSFEGIVDVCICDTGEIIPEFVRRYNLAGSNVVNIDTSSTKETGVKIIKADLATIDGEYIRHDPDEIAKKIIELIHNELRFRDKQTDEQFMLLDTKLKEEDRKKKSMVKAGRRTKELKPAKKNRIKKSSKFNVKYRERIKSIKHSEKTRQDNIKIQKKAQELIAEEEKKEKERFLKESYKGRKKK